MPEIRQSIATKEWVIIATERARRPHEFLSEERSLTEGRPAWDADCPFCPGNEEPSPSEQLRIPETGPWELRVVLNKYPALSQEGERIRQSEGIYRMLSGVGRHEVIIEAPRHNTCLALMQPGEVARTLLAFQARGQAYTTDSRIEHIVYFENHGRGAGTSIEHPHAQMVGLPMVPQQVRSRTEEAQRYFDDTGHCVFCDIRDQEISAGDRMIAQNADFAAFTPYAARSPFHTWILPRRHASAFLAADPVEVHALAEILKEVLLRCYVGLRDPGYNFNIREAPLGEANREDLHWYVSLVPRVTESAGFEMGTGMFINTLLPEESAAFLRSVRLV
jgi:UDPglucose--hexose-1-phosphate uridylyltransferase